MDHVACTSRVVYTPYKFPSFSTTPHSSRIPGQTMTFLYSHSSSAGLRARSPGSPRAPGIHSRRVRSNRFCRSWHRSSNLRARRLCVYEWVSRTSEQHYQNVEQRGPLNRHGGSLDSHTITVTKYHLFNDSVYVFIVKWYH